MSYISRYVQHNTQQKCYGSGLNVIWRTKKAITWQANLFLHKSHVQDSSPGSKGIIYRPRLALDAIGRIFSQTTSNRSFGRWKNSKQMRNHLALKNWITWSNQCLHAHNQITWGIDLTDASNQWEQIALKMQNIYINTVLKNMSEKYCPLCSGHNVLNGICVQCLKFNGAFQPLIKFNNELFDTLYVIRDL